MSLVIGEKNVGGALAQFTHVFGILVITPAISWHTTNGLVHGFKVGVGTLHDFFRREAIDWIERSHIYAELVDLSAKRTDPARDIQNSFSSQTIRLQQEVAAYSSNVRPSNTTRSS